MTATSAPEPDREVTPAAICEAKLTAADTMLAERGRHGRRAVERAAGVLLRDVLGLAVRAGLRTHADRARVRLMSLGQL